MHLDDTVAFPARRARHPGMRPIRDVIVVVINIAIISASTAIILLVLLVFLQLLL